MTNFQRIIWCIKWNLSLITLKTQYKLHLDGFLDCFNEIYCGLIATIGILLTPLFIIFLPVYLLLNAIFAAIFRKEGVEKLAENYKSNGELKDINEFKELDEWTK